MERPSESPPISEQIQVTQAAGVIALGNVASRALGLLREMVKSGLFGAGPHVDALNAAFRVPNTLYDLLIGGMINSALIPVFSDYAAPEQREELWRLLSLLLSLGLVVLCGLVLAGELLAPQLVWLIAGGMAPTTQTLAVGLLRLVLPAVLFLNLAGILAGALYALKRFTFPAFIAAIFNAAIVALALALGRRWGVRSMAVGLLVGAALQVAFQLPGLRGVRLRPAFDLHHPALARIGRLYLPILIGLVVDNTLAVFLSYNLASHIGASRISWMEYAATIIQFPLGLVVTAVSLAILPTLSRQASADEPGPFRTTLSQGLRLVLALVIPATVGLYVLARPVVALVFEHGDFTPADTAATAEALRCALLGLIFAAVDQPLIFAFYARKDTLTPALVGVGATLLYALAALSLWWLGVLTLPLLVLVNSLKLTVHALAMLALTRRRLGGLEGRSLWGLTLKATLASLAMGGAVWGVARALAGVAPAGLAGELLVVGGAGGTGLVVYGLLALALRMEEIRLLRLALTDGLARLTGRRPPDIITSTEARMGEKKQPAQPVPSDLYDHTYFLSACEGYEEFVASEGRELSRRLRAAFEVAGIEPGMRVLDVGCGRGEILRRCTHLGAQAHGIDYAAAAVAMSHRALEEGEAAGVYRADAKYLPFADGVFDRVLLFDIVEHLHSWELDQALGEVWRVLRPDGRVIIHTAPNVWYDRYAYPVVRLVRILMG
ncbi:MAG TPA: murein biosynthesis integral membrane protein MurJ, partial [Chloroflexi bacterium]|nr:murein biosynthesis integral membrane protein MurJ [Chloroflexota bacterium]